MERLFAKPFICAMDDHRDGVYTLCNHPTKLSTFLSASIDGEVKVWDIAQQKCVSSVQAHDSWIAGLTCLNSDPSRFISVARDGQAKMWRLPNMHDEKTQGGLSVPHLLNTYETGDSLFGVSAHAKANTFAASNSRVLLFDVTRSEPVAEMSYGSDAMYNSGWGALSFNPAETSMLAAAGREKGMVMFDTRVAESTARLTLTTKVNNLSWNPHRPMEIALACDGGEVMQFDARKLDTALRVQHGHVLAVMDVQWAPTGRELCTAGYDSTIRIFGGKSGKSRDTYHTKRMQRVQCVRWTQDARFIVSGSDDGNVRVWKARAAEKLGAVSA
ncbi:hypothetical protein KIPB_011780, partial [Kipferlia bialata]|eukprot:g11780.t1